MEILALRDPIEKATARAVIERGEKLRVRHQEEAAAAIANEVASRFS